MPNDRRLSRWSLALLILAGISVLVTVVAPFTLCLHDAPVTLSKGTEVWSTTLYALPLFERSTLLTILMLPQIAWIIVAIQIACLARHFARGHLFDVMHTRYFIRIGIALIAMGVLDTLSLPLINALLYYRHISPWLGDMPWLAMIQPDLMMAGLFFFILGKIMYHGAILHETDQLTV